MATAVRRALAAPWDPITMRAVSKEDRKLEAMIVATNTMMHGLDDEDISDVDSDIDGVDTHEVLDKDDERATAQFLFNQASSNESVTTLDTRGGGNKSHESDDDNVHEIAPPPTKKRKESHLDDDSEN